MLGGRVDHQLDEKMRMRIPQNYLAAFPRGERLFFVEYAPDCISIMPESVKDRRLGSLDDIDPDDEERFDAMRVIYASVVPVEADKQGRVSIPKHLRDMAGLQKNLVTIGFSDFIEVWDRDRYERKRASMSVREANKIYYGRKKQEHNE